MLPFEIIPLWKFIVVSSISWFTQFLLSWMCLLLSSTIFQCIWCSLKQEMKFLLKTKSDVWSRGFIRTPHTNSHLLNNLLSFILYRSKSLQNTTHLLCTLNSLLLEWPPKKKSKVLVLRLIIFTHTSMKKQMNVHLIWVLRWMF